MVRRRVVTVLVALSVSLVLTCDAASAAPTGVPLTRLGDVSLPGGASRFDYQAIDQTTRRLYVAHLGDSTLDVIDLAALRVVATVKHLPDIHGVAVAPDRQRVYATATGTNQLATIDAANNQVITHVGTGHFPDGVAYDADHGLIFVSNKNDGSLTIIDATTNTVLNTIKLADETGNVTYDHTTRTIYAAVRTPDALAAIDPLTRAVTTKTALPGCDGAHGLYIDPASQRAFVACENNARLVTVDLQRHAEIGRANIGTGPDVLAFDVALQRLYIASESGTVTAFNTSTKLPRKLGQSHLADAAHTVAVDQTTHRVYFPLQNIKGRPVLRVSTPTSATR
jgi:YVTN family beta-propeller protein